MAHQGPAERARFLLRRGGRTGSDHARLRLGESHRLGAHRHRRPADIRPPDPHPGRIAGGLAEVEFPRPIGREA